MTRNEFDKAFNMAEFTNDLLRGPKKEFHFGRNDMRHHYNHKVNGDHWCPECDGNTVWNDSNHDMAHCEECGACSDPDHTVDRE